MNLLQSVNITYHKEGDFFVPDLYLEKEDYENDYIIGKYGHLRLKYLKNHKKADYIIMFTNKNLRKHIVEIDKQAISCLSGIFVTLCITISFLSPPA